MEDIIKKPIDVATEGNHLLILFNDGTIECKNNDNRLCIAKYS